MYAVQYETVAAGQTDQVLGPTGGAGDWVEGLLCVVATAATSSVDLQDGSGTAINVLPANVGAGIGSYYVPINACSVLGAWSVTTGAGVSVLATGRFA